MLRSTFRCKGVGPSRERELWAKGYTDWDALPAEGLLLSPLLDDRIRATVAGKRALFARGDLPGLAEKLAPSEHWRFWPYFAERACFLDIETDGFSDKVTSVAVFGAARPRAFVRGIDLERFPEEVARYGMVVTFNGASFDLPILRRAFPGIDLPPVHVDLRLLFRRLGERGGLKAIEQRLGLARPGSVEGVDGFEAVRLWRRWESRRDAAALLRLVEYNVHDTIQLRPLLDIAYNRMVAGSGLPLRQRPIYDRNEVLPAVGALIDELAARLPGAAAIRGAG